jgi:hypothetical protein
MTYESDAFISYSHLDNIELSEGHKGWVAKLHSALETRVTQGLGRPARFFRDPQISGNVELSETLVKEIRSVAAFVSIVSPGYLKSTWGRRELEEFCSAARTQGGLHVQDRARIFKVLKTRIPLEDHPEPLQSLLGYEFFKIDPETGRVRELDEIYGPDAEQEFWQRLLDLAEDLCALLRLIEAGPGEETGAQTRSTIFLAETTSDLRGQRDAIKRELQQHGCLVLPDQPLPLLAVEAAASIREHLERSDMSIHMIGRNYGLVPEGGLESILEVQNDLAIERSRKGAFSRLVWIPRGLKISDERQAAVIEELRMDQRIHSGSDLLETSLEDLKTAIETRLAQSRQLQEQPTAPDDRSSASQQVYLLYDKRDADAILPWADFLVQHFEVIQPAFSGDEREIRQYHDECLRTCDGVMIFYGAASDVWLGRKLNELQKSPGYGRTKRMPEVAICLIPPHTAEKNRLRRKNAFVVPQWDGMTPDALRPFVSAVKTRGEEGQRDRDGDPV